jgi:hypothetical protein
MNVSGTEVLSMQVDIYAEKEKSATNKRGTRELGGKIGNEEFSFFVCGRSSRRGKSR